MSSLRLRLALAFGVGQLVLLSVATVAAQRVGSDALTRQFDAGLTRQATSLVALLEQRGNHVGIELDETFQDEYFREEAPDYFELYYRGVAFGRSPRLGEHDLALTEAGTFEAPTIWDARLPDGRLGRLAAFTVEVPEVEADPATGELPAPARVTLVLARGRAELDGLAQLLLYGLLVVDLALLALGLLLTWGVVTHALRPVRGLAARVASVDVHTLSDPLSTERVPSELHAVVAGVNALLERLDVALRAERRSASNVAHELMTPIAELRALTEVALQGDDGGEYRERALGTAHEISLQMTNLIHVVRRLSKLEDHPGPIETEELALAPLVEAALARYRERADERGLAFDVAVNGAVVRSNRDALQSVLGNLVGNAVAYSPEGSRIDVNCDEQGSVVILRIANECGDLAAEDLERVTEPFWRGSSARTGSEHHGLGLSIARGLAALCGVTLSFELEAGRFVARATAARIDA